MDIIERSYMLITSGSERVKTMAANAIGSTLTMLHMT